MVNGYESFDNNEMNFRKDSLIQERVGLISAHMYKEYLDYQNVTINTTSVFNDILLDLKLVVESLQKSFMTRNLPMQNNIRIDCDAKKTVATIQILWHTISFTTRCNFKPQALYRENQQPMFCGRIMAIKGSYNDIIKPTDNESECMEKLRENEIASLYVPTDNMQNAIFKIRHLANREFALNSQDCAKEFVLKVIEIICGSYIYHEEGSIKGFNIK